MPDLKHGSGTKKVPYHLQQRYENKQRCAQESDENRSFEKNNVAKMTESRISLEYLDKSALITQCKASKDYNPCKLLSNRVF